MKKVKQWLFIMAVGGCPFLLGNCAEMAALTARDAFLSVFDVIVATQACEAANSSGLAALDCTGI